MLLATKKRTLKLGCIGVGFAIIFVVNFFLLLYCVHHRYIDIESRVVYYACVGIHIEKECRKEK